MMGKFKDMDVEMEDQRIREQSLATLKKVMAANPANIHKGNKTVHAKRKAPAVQYRKGGMVRDYAKKGC